MFCSFRHQEFKPLNIKRNSEVSFLVWKEFFVGDICRPKVLIEVLQVPHKPRMSLQDDILPDNTSMSKYTPVRDI